MNLKLIYRNEFVAAKHIHDTNQCSKEHDIIKRPDKRLLKLLIVKH